MLRPQGAAAYAGCGNLEAQVLELGNECQEAQEQRQ